ncbi:MAG: hypothetical protein K0S32_2433 [Bacteroidetes bacterium]|jgi:uncharacterized protein YigE (DUF2233 family)|nr:hypothetical protein [Bacteroidota bacterium]
MTKQFFSIISFIAVLFLITSFELKQNPPDSKILDYIADPKTQDIKLYWKNDSAKPLRSILNLKNYLEGKKKNLIFAMNGGMYMEDNSPLGLFIQEQKNVHKINKADASGNFYMKPNGIFYITTDKKAGVCKTEDFKNNKINYATQSGPMLVIDGKLHPEFKEGSKNLNIRNGVGILPDGKILFAMSKEPISFFDFATYFKSKGCKNALYLDGFVSRTYLPEKNWLQTDGNFGVLIGVTTNKK